MLTNTIRTIAEHVKEVRSAGARVLRGACNMVVAGRRLLAQNGHDKNAKRSLAIVLSRRRKLLRYLMRTDYANYRWGPCARTCTVSMGHAQCRRSLARAHRLVLRECDLRAIALINSKYSPIERVREPHKIIKHRHSKAVRRQSRGNKGH